MHLTVHDGYGRVALQILSLGRQAKCRCYWNWKVEPTIQMKDEDDKKFSIVVLIVDVLHCFISVAPSESKK